MRTLVGAVGYRNLRDHSAAFEVLARLERANPGDDVVVEDISYNPSAVVQWLEGEPIEQRFEHVVVVAAVERGAAAGTITAYRWDGVLPPEGEIQEAIVEAVTGVIALENTVVIAGHFGVLPQTLAIVEIEPQDHEFGSELSARVNDAIEPATNLVRRLATDRAAVAALPVRPLARRHAARIQA